MVALDVEILCDDNPSVDWMLQVKWFCGNLSPLAN